MKLWIILIGIALISFSAVPFAVILFINGNWIGGTLFIVPFLVVLTFLYLIWDGRVEVKKEWLNYMGEDN